MIIIYPKQFEGNQKFPEEIEVSYRNSENWNYPVPIDGFLDTIIIDVHHKEGVDKMNYVASYNGGTLHVIKTEIDCNHHSDNLNYLIKVFQKFENIL
jgi:hypothetical protein